MADAGSADYGPAMGIDLGVVIGSDAPFTREALLRLPQRLSGAVFERESEALARAAGYAGLRTAQERERFCRWEWETARWIAGLWPRRTTWKDTVAAAANRGLPPYTRWAGFSVYFFRGCLCMTHLEKYGAFLQNRRYGLREEAGLRLRLRRCCFAIASALGGRAALYLADTAGPAAHVSRWLHEGLSFDDIEARVREAFGPPPASFPTGTVDDWFVDDFHRVGPGSRLYLGAR